VLDNTGSMNSTDVAPTRIAALKTASHSLLSILQAAATTPGDVQIAIIPFNNGVNVDPANVNETWLDWSYFKNSGGAGWGGSGGGYGGGSYGGGGYDRPRREMHPAVCANCGKETQVPFVPRGDRPVYCSDCYAQMGGGSRGRR